MLKVGESIGTMTKRFASINPLFGVFTGLAAGVASAGIAAAGALTAMAVETAEATDKMFHQSEIAGTSFENFQKLAVGAKMYEISSEELAMSLARMSRQAIVAAEASNYSATAFGRLGINVRDASGQLKDSGSLFTEVMDKLSGMTNETERNALALQLMGRSAVGLIPALAAGSAQFKTYGEFAERVGYVLSTEAGEGAHAFSVAMKEVETITEGAQRQIAAGITPALTELITAFADAQREGELFKNTGVLVGDGIKLLGEGVAYTAYGIEYLVTKIVDLDAALQKLQISQRAFLGIEPKEQADAEKAAIDAVSEYQDHKLVEAKSSLDAFVSALSSPVDLSKAKGIPTGGEGADISQRSRAGRAAVEPDVVAKFNEETSRALDKQLALSNAISGSAAQEALYAAAVSASDKVSQTEYELQTKLKSLISEQTAERQTQVSQAALIAKSVSETQAKVKVAVDPGDKVKLQTELDGLDAKLRASRNIPIHVQTEEVTRKISEAKAELSSLAEKRDVTKVVHVDTGAPEAPAAGATQATLVQERINKLNAQLEQLKQPHPVSLDLKSQEIETRIADVKRQLAELGSSDFKVRIIAEFQQTAVLESITKANEEINKVSQATAQQIDEQEKLNSTASRDTVAQFFLNADDRAKSFTEKLTEAREELVSLVLSPDTSIDVLVKAEAGVDALTAKLAKLKAQFETAAVLEQFTKLTDEVNKSVISTQEEIKEQEQLSSVTSRSAAETLFEKADEKARSFTVSVQEARANFERLESLKSAGDVSINTADVDAARVKVEALEKQLRAMGDVKVSFETAAVLSSLNEVNSSVTKSTVSISQQIDMQRQLNAARLESATAYASAQTDEKIKSETIELRNAEEEYRKLNAVTGESRDDTAIEAVSVRVTELRTNIEELRSDYATLAETDPDYWNKLQQDVDATQEKYGSLTQAVEGFVNELALQGINSQQKVFQNLTTAADGLESSLGKLFVQGRGKSGFVEVLKQMEEGLIKIGLQLTLLEGKKILQGFIGGAQGGGGLSGGLAGGGKAIEGIVGGGIKSVGSIFGLGGHTIPAGQPTPTPGIAAQPTLAQLGATDAYKASVGVAGKDTALIANNSALLSNTTALGALTTALGVKSAGTAASAAGSALSGSALGENAPQVGDAGFGSAALPSALGQSVFASSPLPPVTGGSGISLVSKVLGGLLPGLGQNAPQVGNGGFSPSTALPAALGQSVYSSPPPPPPPPPPPAPSGSSGGGAVAQSVGLLSKGTVLKNSASDAAKVFHEVMMKTPWPVNWILAPIVAGVVFGAEMLLGGKLEAGGPAQAGVPYIVGERRPELFVPKESGTVIPFVPSTFNSRTGTFFGKDSPGVYDAIHSTGAVKGRADGGETKAGETYVVGEKQPELFIPKVSGQILPSTSSFSTTSSAISKTDVSNVARSAAISTSFSKSSDSFKSRSEAMRAIGPTLNIPRREYGGPVTAGQSYLVGEANPERFVPDAPERKESSAASGASGFQPGHTVTVNTSISAIDASGFDKLLDKHADVIHDHVNEALRSSNRRIS